MMKRLVFIYLIFLLACGREEKTKINTLFTRLSPKETGIDFANTLTFNDTFNIYTYRNFYNGGGVGLGDINNDGLLDIYMCASMSSNKLYLNKGNFQFEDITEKAGLAVNAWSTGVSMVDINGDGLLDLYICKSGDVNGVNRYNQLFINNGDLTFTDRTEEYGLVDKGFSTHAAFFDYDKDGDLDCYLLNNSFRPIGSYDLRQNLRKKRDPNGGNRFYKNEGGKFVDASEEVGVYGSAIGFGLGVTVGDVNRDGWMDMYVSNDFFERDYLYINQKNGTFRESLEEQVQEISAASMGADMADINNDGYPEIFGTDMLPEGNARLKTKTTFENWDKYKTNLDNGYYRQFTRNVFQLNNGDGTFSEIGRYSGVYATDWSWGALIFDWDNDGKKDLFVANGIYQDLTDQDFINFIADPRTITQIISKKGVDFKKLIDAIPSNKIPNYAFENQGDLTFTNKAQELGLGEPSFSNGAAYGDLDNDGDLDLITNNTQMPAFVYRNDTDKLLPQHAYLQFELKGKDQNTQAIGTQITVKHQGTSYFIEQMPMRGFQSTMDARPLLGLGNLEKVDSVIVRWPDDTYTLLEQVATRQTLKLEQAAGVKLPLRQGAPAKPIFRTINKELDSLYLHKENNYLDFDRDRLLYHMISAEGPKIVLGDVNGDKRDDFYVCGPKDAPGRLFVQQPNGMFLSTNEALFKLDSISEESDALFIDIDGDKDLDLYVVTGGNEFPESSSALIDRLYLNNGKGIFSKATPPLLAYESNSCIEAGDVDGDGDLDLFLGGRMKPFAYGLPANSHILINESKGVFRDATREIAPDLTGLGMVKDALWVDIDQDKDQDLIVVGEWMPVTIFLNENGRMVNHTDALGLGNSHGWWNAVKATDLDKDGDLDFILGNHGLNSRFKANAQQPVCIHIGDFDGNNTAEHLMCVYNEGVSYPLALRHDLVMQIPSLKKKYLKYESYQDQRYEDIFTPEERKDAITLNAYEMRSSVLINEGGGRLRLQALPKEAQLSPVYAIACDDFDRDGNVDVLLAGNFSRAKPEIGTHYASYGVFLKGDGKGGLGFIPNKQTGFTVFGEVKALENIQLGTRKALLVGRNDDYMLVRQY